jgi:hypothetical protein
MARVLFTLGGNPQGEEPKNRPKPVHTWANGRGHRLVFMDVSKLQICEEISLSAVLDCLWE